LDDLTPLHQINDEIGSSNMFLFKPRDAHRIEGRGFRGDRAPKPRPVGALIYYYLAEELDEEIQLEILDDQDQVVRTFQSKVEKGQEVDDEEEEEQKEKPIPAKEGMNRFVWDLKHEKLDIVKGSVMSLGYTGGYWAVPGNYKVRLSKGEDAPLETSFQILKDQRLTEVTQEDIEKQFELVTQVRDKITEIHNHIRTIRSVREQMKNVVRLAKRSGIEGDFEDNVESIDEKLTSVEEELVQTKNESGQDPLNFPPKIDNQFVYLYGHVNGAYGRPTEGSLQRFEDLAAHLQPHVDQLKEILDVDVARSERRTRVIGASSPRRFRRGTRSGRRTAAAFPGSTTSLAYSAVPAIFSGASRRGTSRPTIRYSAGALSVGFDGGVSRAAASASSP